MCHFTVIYWDVGKVGGRRRERSIGKERRREESNYEADVGSDIYSPKPHGSFIKISVLISKHLFSV